MGMGSIRSVFEFWRPILDLGKDKLTTDMARRTFCTLGSKYTRTEEHLVLFKLPAQQLMEVTHHRCPDQFQSYVVNAAWRDPEAEAHAARTFSLWAQGQYEPPITNSLPDTLGIMDKKHESAFNSLKRSHKDINSTSQLILKEIRRARDDV